ncbi:MAG TPA: C-type lectin domain-containing protein [Polyangiaceae bacterium]|nr:C-type lectin domain-containing protein [Polyangiaceae bacterium]
MLRRIHSFALIASLAAVACATSEAVDEGAGDAAATGGGTGIAGSGGLSGGGFPGKVDGGGGGPTGSGGGSGGVSCSAEVCNGRDDDCDGKADNGVCSPGCTGQEYLEHGYSFCSTTKELSDAAADCISQKMRLTRPNDAAENDWLRQTATGMGLGALWLGATDWTTEGDWSFPDGAQVWTGGQNGSVVGGVYTNWAQKHPTGSGSNDCMQMNAAGEWSEVSCKQSVAYVCEDY